MGALIFLQAQTSLIVKKYQGWFFLFVSNLS